MFNYCDKMRSLKFLKICKIVRGGNYRLMVAYTTSGTLKI